MAPIPTTSPRGLPTGRRSRRRGSIPAVPMNSPRRIDLVSLAADGSGETVLTGDLPHEYGGPTWSPDGTTIAFASNFGDIWVMNADGSDPRDIATALANFDQAPTWPPDGQRLAFFRGNGLFVMNADGSDPHVLVANIHHASSHPSWSPDGSEIAFVENVLPVDVPTNGYPSRGRLEVVDVSTGVVTRLTDRSKETFEALRERVLDRFEALGPNELKGVADPAPSFRAASS
jgi:Tol biopolymer transport system component